MNMSENYKYHADMSLPQNNKAIFVFGSNLAGIHGAGSAKYAKDKLGAKLGIGKGFAGGSTYAIPTKDYQIKSLSLDEIQFYVEYFKKIAKKYITDEFFVTRIGCGLAGYTDSQIAPLFKGSTQNCDFPIEWKPYLE